MSRRLRVGTVAAASVLSIAALLGACGKSDSSTTTAQPTKTSFAEGECRTGAQAAVATAPKLTTPKTTTKKLVVTDDIEGCGAAIPKGEATWVTVNYVGRSQSTGKDFDTSFGKQAQTFQVGNGSLIQAWDEGLVGMKEGGRRTLLVPGDLGYGALGSPPDIGSNDTLLFVVDLIGIGNSSAPQSTSSTTTTEPKITRSTAADAPTACRSGADAEKAKAPVLETPKAKTTELVVTDLIVGCGTAVPSGSVVQATVNYVGRSQSTGKDFDSSFTRGEPVQFPIGVSNLIPGWELGLVGMKEGGRRMLLVPGSLAYGATGQGSDIGPDDTLLFVVDLIKVES